MADRFLHYLREVKFDKHEQLLAEIQKYKKALDSIYSDDEGLLQALNAVENECLKNISEKEEARHKRKSSEPHYSQKKLKRDSCISSTSQNCNARKQSNYVCSCGKSYKHRQSLHKHKKKCKVQSTSGLRINTSSETSTLFKCRYCGVTFNEYTALVNHLERYHPIEQTGTGDVATKHEHLDKSQRLRMRKERKIKTTSALNNSVQIVNVLPTREEKYDLVLFFAKVKEEVREILDRRRQNSRNIKFYMNTRVKMIRNLDTGDGNESTTTPHFRCKTTTALENDDLDYDLNSAFQQMSNNMEEFINKGSDWKMDEVVDMEVVTVPYSPINGSSYLPLPPEFEGIRSLVNVRNRDQKCFLWSVLAALHPASHHPERLSHYLDFEHELDCGDIKFPVSLSQISKFETRNSVSINVFGMEGCTIFPMYLSKIDISRAEVDLLYLKNGETTHYCLIKDLDKFLSITKKAKIKHYFCRRCLHGFIRKDLLHEHKPFCKMFDFQHVKYPKEGEKDILEFKNFHKQLRVPFVIYADFETLVEKINGPSEPETTYHDSHLKPCGYSYKVVCCNENYSKPPVVFRGENAVEHFLESLTEEENDIKDIMSESEPLVMNEETERAFELATECHICNAPFSEKSIKVRDHFHIGVKGNISAPNYSNYRGAACQDCNLNFTEPKFIPVIFHNLRGFDGHLLCQAIGKYKERDIKCIAQNMNRYISTSLGDLRFIDSFQFMSSSLEKLVENLAAEGLSHFTHFRKTFEDESIAKLLLRKNVYCYDYFDTFEKFGEQQLPPKEAFFNRFKKEHISDEDYQQVQEVWTTLKMQTLGDLHDNYVLTDVLLLADVFEKFRDMTLNFYGLDACHYFTAPGLAWDAALKMTDVKLDLLTDPLKYNFFEAGIRGGVSMISKKFSTANNPHVKNYDSSKAHKYLMYLDANNLYGGVMRMPLPVGMMRWLSEEEIQKFNIESHPAHSKTGYTLEVDLDYPDDLHDDHNCYPLAPEHKLVIDEEISPYNEGLWKTLYTKEKNSVQNPPTADKSQKRPKVSKLIPTLEDKKNYVVHYRTLQLYLSLGLKCTKIHRILEYRQEPWLRTYIDFNSEKRKFAKSEFEKDFFKLMNNSVFGKTMENLRNRVDIKLIQTKEKLKKYCAKPSFQRLQVFSENLVGVENKKTELLLNKPVYVGQTILDLAKLVMYNFHYNVMKRKYGDKVELLFTDTDSLMYEIETNDVYKDMASSKHLYDLSNYPSNHHLFDRTNEKTVLKMKDECEGVPVSMFIGLRPKMYSILLNNDKEKRTAKGITKAVIKKQLNHELYKKCLAGTTKTFHEMISIRSELHELFVDKINKAGLCAYDDKRYVRDCGVKTYAYGHYAIRDHITCKILKSLETT